MTEYYSYETRSGHGLPFDPFKAIVAPRPIGWISSVSADGVVNLAPYSFFNGFSTTPPIVGFGSEGRKDSLRNIEETKGFVCNLATRPLAGQMNTTSGNYPHGIDEMKKAGLAALPSRHVAAPRVAESPAALECRLVEARQLRDADQNPIDGYLVLGEVVAVHINTEYLVEGRFDMVKAHTIARCGYKGDYAEVTELFEMFRPAV